MDSKTPISNDVKIAPAFDAESAPGDHIAEKADLIAAEGADDALKYAAGDGLSIDPDTNRRILRKIDRHIMPWLGALYFLQFMDKQMLSYAAVMGINTDAHLTPSQYSWLGSIYYLGYMVGAYPHTRMMQHFPHEKYLGVCATIWGSVLCCMAACNNFAGLMCIRAFMGFFEVAVSCGFLLITAKWYRKFEHATRVGIWAGCNGLSAGIGGVVAYGCYQGSKNDGITFPSWKIMALVTGATTVLFGASMFSFMSESAVKSTFLNEEEKTIAVERIRGNHQGVGSHQFKWHQFREAFTDLRTWLYVLFILTSQIPLAGTTLFSSLLIKSLNFDSATTLLLALPGGVIQIFACPGFGFMADRTQQRSLTAATTHAISIFFISLQVGLSHHGLLFGRIGQLIAYFVLAGNGAVSLFVVFSMVSSNALGTTKKTTVTSIVFMTNAVAYLVGPQMFRTPPYYTKAKDATIGLWVAALLVLFAIYALNRHDNKKRDREAAEATAPLQTGVEFLDLTDKENHQFRYVL